MTYETATLPCGLRIICAQNQSHVASCGIAVDAGTRDEFPQESGIAHFKAMQSKIKKSSLAALLILASCGNSTPLTMTADEARLINESPDIMRILSVDNETDLAVLRASSSNFNATDLNTAEYQSLAKKLVLTLQNTDDGVGLAAPQVGINRRVVAVQRVDKEGEPVEVYPNIRIVEFRGQMEEGPEGCLSVPGRRGSVDRYQEIDITYTQAVFRKNRLTKDVVAAGVKDTTETVKGFTAVIFQHECDHLDGVLYIDKLTD